MEAFQRCALCRGLFVPPRSQSSGHGGSVVRGLHHWESSSLPGFPSCSHGAQPRERPPCLRDSDGRPVTCLGWMPGPRTCGIAPPSQRPEDRGLACRRGLWGAGCGQPRPLPRCSDSLISFLFRGVILRPWCHQRVEGQGLHFISYQHSPPGVVGSLATLQAGGSQA